MSGKDTEWPQRDLVFAVDELSREFPQVAPNSLFASVATAAADLPISAGRVALVSKAREVVRHLSSD